MDEAQRLCDRLAVIARGRVLATGTAAELIATHQSETVVRFTAPAGADLSCLNAVPTFATSNATVTRCSCAGVVRCWPGSRTPSSSEG